MTAGFTTYIVEEFIDGEWVPLWQTQDPRDLKGVLSKARRDGAAIRITERED
jgi:hypothetical protein